MSFIAAVKPLLSSNTDSITITLNRNTAGQLTATVVPRIALTEAQESDPAIAILKAALARPLLVELPEVKPDATFSAILAGVAPSRDAAQVALTEYLAAIEAAKAEAKAKAEETKAKADAKAKATPAKGAKAAKPAAVTTSDDSSGDDDGDDDAESDSASSGTDTATAPVPAASTTETAQPALLADLF